MFDPNLFLEQSFIEANDTKPLPVPEGEYLAVIDSMTPRTWQKKDDPSVGGLVLDLVWSIEDQNLKATLDREKITIKQGIMLDLNEAGALDMGKGKNISLGRLREAVGLNIPGQAFSFTMLPGQMAKVVVKHRIYNDEIFADVKSVVKPQ